ncbi:MAG: Na(+)-translocating NADH-quinone reductase subunit A [Bacteroidales bacterium]|jgi:Na+-transporting NADH:ubiquinone oxidoreductase subunit A|nr:Na(+)-translocating NADH-quinone reductase subunit A [Bacteroidales bacterium]
MSKEIRLKRGFTIRIEGEADKSLMASLVQVESYAVKPTDFYGMRPKLLVEEGAAVKAGTPLFYDKADERIKITSPVSGVISAIVRGEKRVIEEIRIMPDEQIQYIDFGKAVPAELSKQQVTSKLLESGLWAMIRQRPYNVVANPDDQPKMVVISAFDTAPMGADYDFAAHGCKQNFQAGVDALGKLTDGKVHLNVHENLNHEDVFLSTKNVEINTFSGKHPAGNVGVQIHHIDPINKGEVVWFVNPQDVIIIGRLFTEGHLDATKIVALAGSELKRTGYHKIIAGASIKSLVEENLIDAAHPRFITGNVLTGKKIAQDGYLGFYDHLISVIPEGDSYEFAGWAMPGFRKFSFWRSFFSWMMPDKKYVLDTNYHGGHRALIFTGQYEKVLPMDIYPMQLIKACITEDIEAMEALGIYEVDSEDFALCEYIDPSKTEIQSIIRKSMDLVKQEMS